MKRILCVAAAVALLAGDASAFGGRLRRSHGCHGGVTAGASSCAAGATCSAGGCGSAVAYSGTQQSSTWAYSGSAAAPATAGVITGYTADGYAVVLMPSTQASQYGFTTAGQPQQYGAAATVIPGWGTYGYTQSPTAGQPTLQTAPQQPGQAVPVPFLQPQSPAGTPPARTPAAGDVAPRQ